jgi:DNA-binding NtrC family response regulator
VLHVPPLCERAEDVVPLAEELLEEIAARDDLDPRPQLDAGAIEVLRAHPWPGNVRQLKNVLERAALLSRRARLRAADLDLDDPRDRKAALSLKESVHDHVRRRVIEALALEEGNQTRAAKRLGIGRRTLIDHMQRYGIER